MFNTILWLEWRAWGMNPTGYRVVNLIIHIVDALLIWFILRKLSIPGAFLAALIFAVHPVNVESVAWITQLRNVLTLFFFLLSIWCYLQAETEPSKRQQQQFMRGVDYWYGLSLATFILAMLSKGSSAALPALLLEIIWWRRGVKKWDLIRLLPFFLISVFLTGVNIWFQTHGSGGAIRTAGFAERLLGAGGVVWFYLYKAFLPINLAFVYPQWRIEVNNPLWWLPLLAALAVTAVLWRYRQTWARPLLFAWGFFCAALVPVMGFADVGFMKYSLVADHYQHIAIIGVIALAAAGWSVWRRSIQKKSRWAATLAAVAAAGSLALLASQQSAIYRDGVTLYRATLEKNPECWMAHNNLGGTLAQSGRQQDAQEQFEQALGIRPDYPEAHNNLGALLSGMGRLQEAVEHYQEAIRLRPDYADAHNNLGNALDVFGRTGEAIEQFQQALRLKPNYADAHNGLGAALVQTGKYPEAIEQFQQAVLLKPDYLNAHINLTIAYSMLGQHSKAVEAAEKTLEMARSQGHADLVQRIENWLNSYRGSLPDVPNTPSPSKSAAPTP
ncbi:MAG: tetratricopeptide repeat protein [Thermoguttaceae bacterium]